MKLQNVPVMHLQTCETHLSIKSLTARPPTKITSLC